MKYRLGKLPARPGAVSLLFSDIFNAAALPTPPAVFGHESVIGSPNWGMFANDQWGDCVLAGAAHETMLWSRAGGDTPANFTDVSVLSDYSAITGFAGTDATDNGTDMSDAAAYRQKTGIIDANGQRHTITAYLAISVGNFEELMLATWLFGAVGVGVNLPSNAEDQFDANQPWSIDPTATLVGGHYIPVVGRDANGNALAVSWGRGQPLTKPWFEQYNDETIAYFSPEYVDMTKLSPEGFNATALEQFLKELT